MQEVGICIYCMVAWILSCDAQHRTEANNQNNRNKKETKNKKAQKNKKAGKEPTQNKAKKQAAKQASRSDTPSLLVHVKWHRISITIIQS